MIKFYIINQTIRFASPAIAADSLNYLECEFDFSGDGWDGASKWVHFRQEREDEDIVYDIAIENDLVTADKKLNLTLGEWEVYVTGTNGDSRITTVPVILTVYESGLIDGPLHELPLTAAEQIDQKAERALLIAQAVKDMADSGELDGPAGPQGAIGPAGPQGPAGPAGTYVGDKPPSDPAVSLWIKASTEREEALGNVTIRGHYTSLSELQKGEADPYVGDAYSVGTAAPYDVYIWTGTEWFNNGPVSAGEWGNISGDINKQSDLMDILDAKENKLGYTPGMINPNLLDNWYFGNPVNQRGESSYSGLVYGVDRWKNLSTNVTSSIIDGNLRVESSEALAGGYLMFAQYLETPVIGQTATCSILVADISGSFALTWGNTSNSSDRIISAVISAPGLYTITGICASGPQFVALSKRGSGANYVDIAAVKLELGSRQTLAHQDEGGNWVLNEIPDYGEQLSRCQRYFYRLKNSSNYAARFFTGLCYSADDVRVTFSLPVPMRVLPALTSDAAILAYDMSGAAGISVTEASVIGSTIDMFQNSSFVGVKFTVPGATARKGYCINITGTSTAPMKFDFSAEL